MGEPGRPQGFPTGPPARGLIEPDELRAALDSTPNARQQWESFSPSVRRGILEWIASAKREETSARRIEKTARLAAEGKRAIG